MALTQKQLEDLIFNYAPSCPLGEGLELLTAAMAQLVPAQSTAPDWRSTAVKHGFDASDPKLAALLAELLGNTVEKQSTAAT